MTPLQTQFSALQSAITAAKGAHLKQVTVSQQPPLNLPLIELLQNEGYTVALIGRDIKIYWK